MQMQGDGGSNKSRRSGSSATYDAYAPAPVTSGGGHSYAMPMPSPQRQMMHQHQFADHGNSPATSTGSVPSYEYAPKLLPPVVHSGDQRPQQQHHHIMHYHGHGHNDHGDMPPPPPGYVRVSAQSAEGFVASSAPRGRIVSGKTSPNLARMAAAAVTPDTQSNPQSKHHHFAINQQQQHSSIYHQNQAHNLHYFSNQNMNQHQEQLQSHQEYAQRIPSGLVLGADTTPSRGRDVGSHASSRNSPAPSSSHVTGELEMDWC